MTKEEIIEVRNNILNHYEGLFNIYQKEILESFSGLTECNILLNYISKEIDLDKAKQLLKEVGERDFSLRKYCNDNIFGWEADEHGYDRVRKEISKLIYDVDEDDIIYLSFFENCSMEDLYIAGAASIIGPY